MAFGHNCCCGCVIFSDTFDNRDGNLDEDGVNLPDSDRYVFPATTWAVNVGLGTLVSNSDADAIYFHGSPARTTNVSIHCNLATDGDWAAIEFGGNNITATRTDSGTVEISGMMTATLAPVSPTNFTLKALFYKSELYPEFDCIEPPTLDDYVRFNEFADCPQGVVNAGPGFSNWGLRAKTGVHLDNLQVWAATPNCQGMTLSCASICSLYPETISISISGAVSGQAWCGDTAVPTSCYEQREDCYLACVANHAEGTEGYCQCNCACEQAFQGCHCDYVSGSGSCVKACPCDELNGEWVMDRDGPCSCNYSTTIPLSIRDPGDYENGCESAAWVDAEIHATLVLEYCDTETGQAFVSLYPNMPFASTTVAYWWSGIIPAADFCGGGSIPLITVPEGAAQYADGILLGCPGVGCETPSGYGCGPGETSCSYFVGEEEQELVCTSPVEVICPHAEHTAVTIGNAVVS